MKLKEQNSSAQLSLKSFSNQFLAEMFGVDGRLLKTLKALLFHPGKLTKIYINEKSTAYLSPISLYFMINFVFFLLLPLVNTKNVKFLSFSYSSFSRTEGYFKNKLESDLSKSNMPEEVYKALFDTHLAYNQPALIFIIIPFFALLLKLVEIRRKRFYVEHLVFAFHFMSFFLILFLLTAAASSFIFRIPETVTMHIPVFKIFQYIFYLFMFLFGIYLFQAIRIYYQHSVFSSIWKTTILSLGFIGIFVGYIGFLFFHTLYKLG